LTSRTKKGGSFGHAKLEAVVVSGLFELAALFLKKHVKADS